MIEEINNKYVLTLTGLDNLIHIWRSDIENYGLFSLNELKSLLGVEPSFKDTLYGYKKLPSPNYFEIKPTKFSIGFIVELKLPEPISLNENGLA